MTGNAAGIAAFPASLQYALAKGNSMQQRRDAGNGMGRIGFSLLLFLSGSKFLLTTSLHYFILGLF